MVGVGETTTYPYFIEIVLLCSDVGQRHLCVAEECRSARARMSRYDEAVHAELRQGADELGTTSAAVDSSSSIFPCASASADHGRFTAHIWKRKRYG